MNHRWRGLHPAMALFVWLGCQNPSPLPGDGGPTDVTSSPIEGGADRALPAVDSDTRPPDTRPPDTRDPAACEPGCHYDCFGGLTCHEGGVYQNAFSPRPCCHHGDFAGDPKVCAPGNTPAYSCPSGKCGGPVDRRYESCLRWSAGASARIPDHLLRLACGEGKSHVAGDPCKTDEDCRPAAETQPGQLTCDRATSRCVAEMGPVAPSWYGKTCGIGPAEVVGSFNITLVRGKTCDLCLASWPDRAQCLRQACTMPCQFDEDCPAGSVCMCTLGPSGQGVQQFCAPVGSGFSGDRRGAGQDLFAPGWLKCSDAVDGGRP